MRPLLSLLLLLLSLHVSAALSVYVDAWAATCGNPTGRARANPSGGVAPYIYSWSNGGDTDMITDLAAGTYTVTVTDAIGDEVQGEAVIEDVPSLGNHGPDMFAFGGMTPCVGECNGGFRFYMGAQGQQPVVVTTDPPMDLEFTNQDPITLWTSRQFRGACAGQVVDLQIVDDNGCFGTAQITIPEPVVFETTVLATTGSCTGGTGGTATVQVDLMNADLGYEPYWQLVARDDQGVEASSIDLTFQQAGEHMFFGLHPGAWTAILRKNFGTGPGAPDNCEFTAPFTIADVGSACGIVNGTVHHESNQNCAQDNGEVGVPYRLLEFIPGPFYALTSATGSYQAALPFGNYSLAQIGEGIEQLCPPSTPILVPVSTTPSSINIADSITSPFDLVAHLCNTTARPGFQFNYNLHIRNYSAYPGEATTVDFSYDPIFSYVSSSHNPALNSPGVLRFDLPDMAPFGHANIRVTLQVPADAGLIGTQHDATLQVSSSLAENIANNTTTETLTITGSYDPNDKQARTSTRLSGTDYLLGQDEWIDYMIRFQNTGTDTAFTVVVTDTLSEHLDLRTLDILGSSHEMTPEIRNGSVLVFTFHSILLPDSNVNEASSHGYIFFRIRPFEQPGVMITNAADIYFDFNEPVRTNSTELWMSVTTALDEDPSPDVTLFPSPVDDVLNVQLPASHTARTFIIHGMDGRQIVRQAASLPLHVRMLPSGVYSLEVEFTNGSSMVSRFVKR
ncbi:MAG: hypothetical protein JNM62_16385 [Flavobacteriales bacterium]|nr:hypothetical protein [Flavobacteriales bacterium]